MPKPTSINKNEPDAENQPQQPQPQMIRCGVIPAELVQQLLDFVRDTPAPRKVTDPLAAGLAQAQYAEFPLGPAKPQ